jgi:hypothetical protein
LSPIDQYYGQIYQVLNNNKYEKIVGPEHHIGTLKAVGELKGAKLDNVVQFLRDTFTVAQIINDERLAILDKKIIDRRNGLIIYGYNVTYDGNGHTSGNVPVDEKLYRSGELAELMDCGDMQKEGHKFIGWNNSADSTSGYANNKININRDTTFYAVWIDLEKLKHQQEQQEIQRKYMEEQKILGYTVYLSKTGGKYHRSSCKYLKKTKIAINVNDAKKGYTACKICNP